MADTNSVKEQFFLNSRVEHDATPGSIVSFNTDLKRGIKSFTAQIEPVQDLNGQDAPWPPGGGKNKFDQDTVYSAYKQADGSFIMSGNVALNIQIPISSSLVGQALTFSAYAKIPSGSSITNIRLRAVVNGSGTNSNYVNTSDYSRASVSFTPTSTSDYVLITFGSNGSNDLQVKDIQLEVGSTASDYSPYSNICPITGWTGCNVTRTGKNLIKISSDNYYDGQRSTVAYTDYGVTITATATYGRASYVVYGLKVGTTYTISLNGMSTGDYNNIYINHDRPWASGSSRYGTINLNATASNRSFTFTAVDSTLYVGFYVTSNVTSGVMTITELQLELGSTATVYEPYSGITIPIAFPSEAGTVYGGNLTINEDGTGKLAVDRVSVDLGNLSWTSTISGITVEGGRIFYTLVTIAQQPLMCSIYPYGGSANGNSGAYNLGNKKISRKSAGDRIYIRDDDYTNVNALKSALSGQTVVYYLTTPVEYDLTVDQITTILGNNNVWTDTGDISELKYYTQNPQYGIKWKEDRALELRRRAIIASSPMLHDAQSNTGLVTFNADMVAPMKLTAQIEPVQDLNGYDHPWPAGGGKNIVNVEDQISITNGIKLLASDLPNGTTLTASATVSDVVGSGGVARIRLQYDLDGSTVYSSNTILSQGRSIATLEIPSEATNVCAYAQRNASATSYSLTNIMVEVGSTASDYSPYSNVCPITGHTGRNITRAGVNLCGGDFLAANAKRYLPSGTLDEENRTFYYTAGATITPNIGGFCGSLIGRFKENTRYAIILTGVNTRDSATNLRVDYTDGTSANIGNFGTSKSTIVYVTPSGKTLRIISKRNSGGGTTLYYDECGIFEGVLTADDFVPPQDKTNPISWETEAGTVYGGNLQINADGTGVLTVDKAARKISGGCVNGITAGDGFRGQILYSSGKECEYNGSATYGLCDTFYNTYNGIVNFSASTQSYYRCFPYSTGWFFTLPKSVASTNAEANAWLSDNNVRFVYPLATPTTYNLTAEQVGGIITTLVGTNNVWIDTGGIDVKYWSHGSQNNS